MPNLQTNSVSVNHPMAITTRSQRDAAMHKVCCLLTDTVLTWQAGRKKLSALDDRDRFMTLGRQMIELFEAMTGERTATVEPCPSYEPPTLDDWERLEIYQGLENALQKYGALRVMRIVRLLAHINGEDIA